ncbi:MAG: arginase family protein [Bacteroidales bacterium]|nr:arginase family protein [Bacteroidales bacterium]
MPHIPDVLPYFNPVDLQEIRGDDRIIRRLYDQTLIHRSGQHNLPLSNTGIVLFGTGIPEAANRIREYLYGLSGFLHDHEMADLGNLRSGKNAEDTLIGLTDVVAALGKAQKTIIVIGADSNHILPVFHGIEQLEFPVNLTVADSHIDLMPETHYLNSRYLNGLVSDPETRLFDYVHLGYQTYLNDPQAFERLDQFYFDHYRLGALRDDIREAEPVFRNTDLFAFSLNALRASEAPATTDPSPNGFTAEESCQLTRYAGLSDKLNLIMITGYDHRNDLSGQTAALTAQMIWHFIQGYLQRKKDYPFCDINKYQKYLVNLPKTGHSLTFYKSPATNRWWVEVPFPPSKHPRSLYIACSYNDYQLASDGEIPDRWWKNYQRIN